MYFTSYFTIHLFSILYSPARVGFIQFYDAAAK
jgi:hypothetical protein